MASHAKILFAQSPEVDLILAKLKSGQRVEVEVERDGRTETFLLQDIRAVEVVDDVGGDAANKTDIIHTIQKMSFLPRSNLPANGDMSSAPENNRNGDESSNNDPIGAGPPGSSNNPTDNTGGDSHVTISGHSGTHANNATTFHKADSDSRSFNARFRPLTQGAGLTTLPDSSNSHSTSRATSLPANNDTMPTSTHNNTTTTGSKRARSADDADDETSPKRPRTKGTEGDAPTSPSSTKPYTPPRRLRPRAPPKSGEERLLKYTGKKYSSEQSRMDAIAMEEALAQNTPGVSGFTPVQMEVGWVETKSPQQFDSVEAARAAERSARAAAGEDATMDNTEDGKNNVTTVATPKVAATANEDDSATPGTKPTSSARPKRTLRGSTKPTAPTTTPSTNPATPNTGGSFITFSAKDGTTVSPDKPKTTSTKRPKSTATKAPGGTHTVMTNDKGTKFSRASTYNTWPNAEKEAIRSAIFDEEVAAGAPLLAHHNAWRKRHGQDEVQMVAFRSKVSKSFGPQIGEMKRTGNVPVCVSRPYHWPKNGVEAKAVAAEVERREQAKEPKERGAAYLAKFAKPRGVEGAVVGEEEDEDDEEEEEVMPKRKTRAAVEKSEDEPAKRTTRAAAKEGKKVTFAPAKKGKGKGRKVVVEEEEDERNSDRVDEMPESVRRMFAERGIGRVEEEDDEEFDPFLEVAGPNWSNRRGEKEGEDEE